MMQRTMALIVVMALGLSAQQAGAVEHGFYLGGSLGQSDSGLKSGNVNYSDTDTGWKLIAGFRAFKMLGFEVNYVDLGNTSTAGAKANTKAFDGFVVGVLPIPFVDIYGKVGLVSWKTDGSSPNFSLSQSGSDFAYGAGVGMSFGPVGVRLEYEGFDIQQASTPSLLSIGVTYTFL